jgi:DNA modification methylase
MIREETIGDCRLILGDCREVLPTLGKVDAVVTDPPYGISIAAGGTIGGSNKSIAKDYGKRSWDDEVPEKSLFSMLQDLSNHQIIFGGNYFEGLGPTSCWLVWDKQNTGNFADCELAWTNLKMPVRRIYWRWNGMIRKGDDNREHPTQKPEGVMKWCLEHLPADVLTICDPFMGSGTTGVAAVKMGKAFIGIEREPDYFDIACRRIEQAYKQPDMFIERPMPPKQEAFL